ncbi:MAG: hypothetical protein AAGB02_03140 [Pseudomonadota bacterium]
MADFNAIARSIDVLRDPDLTESAQREIFVAFARDRVKEFEDAWRQNVGGDIGIEVSVNGVKGAPIGSLEIDGTVFARVRPVAPVKKRALQLLDLFTKVRTGTLERSLAVFHDNAKASPETPANPGETTFITFITDYSGRAEVEAYNDIDASGFAVGLIASVVNKLKKEFRGAPVRIWMAWRRVGALSVPGIGIR